MNPCHIPETGVSGLLKNCIIAGLVLTGVYSCSFADRDTGAAVKAASVWEKSPFAGAWVSSDSDQETAFKLYIEQQEDSLFGYYCLIKQNDGQSECQTPDSSQKSAAFSAKTPQASGLSTELYNLKRQSLGHLQLILSDSVLFWQLLRGPDDPQFMIRQTTFRIDSPLE